MKLIFMILYNGVVYPLAVILALLASPFNDKLRRSLVGRFKAPKQLKQYFKENTSSDNIYWFHASSLGEFFQVKTLMERLKEEQEDITCIVSFSSPSGFDNAKSDAMDLKFYLPFDFPWTILGVLNRLRPKKIMFASYDLWPNLVWIARVKDVHINLFSVRMAKGSTKTMPFFRSLFRYVYSSLHSLYTISEKDMKGVCRLLGNTSGPILRVMGNPRYDLVMRDAIDLRDNDVEDMLERDLRIIVGSAHDEEADQLVPALVNLMNVNPDLKVLYALHEPSESAINDIKKKFHDHGKVGRVFRKRSDLVLPTDRLVFVGVVGVLSRLYWQCRIAYVGGGHSTGVHNVMEPAVARLPVLFGPRYHNSHEAEELIKGSGGFCVNNKDEFLTVANKLISDETYFKISSLSASDVIYRNVGSTTKMIGHILSD